MQFMRFEIGNIVELKKPHPCGSNQFKIMRVGSQMRIICLGCSRDMTIDRIKLEKSVKRFVDDGGTIND